MQYGRKEERKDSISFSLSSWWLFSLNYCGKSDSGIVISVVVKEKFKSGCSTLTSSTDLICSITIKVKQLFILQVYKIHIRKMKFLLCNVCILYDLILFGRKQNEGSGGKVEVVWTVERAWVLMYAFFCVCFFKDSGQVFSSGSIFSNCEMVSGPGEKRHISSLSPILPSHYQQSVIF